ncbi:Integral membrane protein OS=Streptomyces violarus OX=67380 GN=FHS41_004124 PE=4 SV=1 [Streptomyces violarus]
MAVASSPHRGPVARAVLAGVGWVARLLLRSCRVHAAEMERGVAAAAVERAQAVDYGLRIVAQEQVGLAYAGWDRLLTRVALPAWRMGRWPSRLDAGVVAALTELSRRDRLAEGFASRLGERPACDLLEEPGAVDEAASLLAARLFHGGPAGAGPDWSPVGWSEYPDEVVDRKVGA